MTCPTERFRFTLLMAQDSLGNELGADLVKNIVTDIKWIEAALVIESLGDANDLLLQIRLQQMKIKDTDPDFLAKRQVALELHMVQNAYLRQTIIDVTKALFREMHRSFSDK